DLPSFPTRRSSDLDPVAVNAGGQIVGSIYTADGKQHASSWTALEGMIDLGAPAGVETKATAINADRKVIGTIVDTNPYLRPFSWTAAGGMIQLGTIGDAYTEAVALNASGQIVG